MTGRPKYWARKRKHQDNGVRMAISGALLFCTVPFVTIGEAGKAFVALSAVVIVTMGVVQVSTSVRGLSYLVRYARSSRPLMDPGYPDDESDRDEPEPSGGK